LAEVNTHRVFSRNSASSRAIPTEKHIERALSDPFIPTTFNHRVKGMGVGDALDNAAQLTAQRIWGDILKACATGAKALNDLDVDKSRANRVLEPFMWHTAIVTSTEWENFFGLRNHEGAQPEFRALAEMMEKEYWAPPPAGVDLLSYGQWHLPLVDWNQDKVLAADQIGGSYTTIQDILIKLSVSRCARVSYEKHADDEPLEASLARYEKLKNSGHLSPFEHAARPFGASEWEGRRVLQRSARSMDFLTRRARDEIVELLEFSGNFRGWTQQRKFIPFESNFKLAQEATVV
jgi:hypothetical protein